MRYRRQVAVCVTGLTFALLATTAGPAAASVTGPKAVTTWAAAVTPHTPSWIELFWTTGKKICHVEVTVAGDDVDVVYPANTADYSSLSQGDTLKPGRVDDTAVQVTTNRKAGSFLPLQATMSYDYCGSKPTARTETFAITLPVLKKP